MLEVLSFTVADCDTDHSLVVARVKESLAVNIQRAYSFHMERLSLKKLN
jgi:hypothetical protein